MKSSCALSWMSHLLRTSNRGSPRSSTASPRPRHRAGRASAPSSAQTHQSSACLPRRAPTLSLCTNEGSGQGTTSTRVLVSVPTHTVGGAPAALAAFLATSTSAAVDHITGILGKGLVICAKPTGFHGQQLDLQRYYCLGPHTHSAALSGDLVAAGASPLCVWPVPADTWTSRSPLQRNRPRSNDASAQPPRVQPLAPGQVRLTL